ncbi:protein FAM92A-A isoform X2 [Aplysia californica]|uniref:Protein FAM92A-A isoform X2 n=1 Tax=Aplysia californica TaxID=6500 RepID=A0ABM0JH28_APLCA|nr:protein FAM92A-A isoform X2 [Aplysia californica]
MSSAHNSVANRDGQVKFAQSRVATVERFYGIFCDTLGSVIRKSARLRDKGDLFAHHLKEYTETEKFNNSTKICLQTFAENFSTIQDYRDTEVQRLEAKVLKPLMRYGELCKNMKSSVKGNTTAWEREKKQVTKLEKLQQKLPSSSPQVTKAQADLNRLRQETGVYGEQLISEVDVFERGKLADMKSVLTEFVQIEMMFHARALKYLSKCFEAAQRIDTEADMDQFRGALLEASGLARSFTQTGTSYSSTGYSTTLGGGTLSSSHGSNMAPGYPQPVPRARPRGDSDTYIEDFDY